jgi:lysozyme family protein
VKSIHEALEIILPLEGGFTNDPNDPGNWTGGSKGVGELKGTKYGISAMSFPDLDIKRLKIEDVIPIYDAWYWNKCAADYAPWPMNLFLFDSAINQGVKPAVKMVQKVLRLQQDGIPGRNTKAKLGKSTNWHAVQFMTARAKRYTGTRNFDRYGDGWLNRLFHLTMES